MPPGSSLLPASYRSTADTWKDPMAVPDPASYRLSDRESRRRFETMIAPAELAAGESQPFWRRPVAAFLGAQPGAGKTVAAKTLMSRLAERGRAVWLSSDLYKPYHPAYDELIRTNEVFAATCTSADSRRWMDMALDYLAYRRVDMVIETTMRTPDYFEAPARHLRGRGYGIEATIVGVPPLYSRFGILVRYLEQLRDTGHGRYVLTDGHDQCVQGVEAAAHAIDQRHLADAVSVIRRDFTPVYTNQLAGPARWAAPARAREVIAAIHARAPSRDDAEYTQLMNAIERLHRTPPSLVDSQWLRQRLSRIAHLDAPASATRWLLELAARAADRQPRPGGEREPEAGK